MQNKELENIIFIDIETVSEKPTYSDLSDSFKKLWDKKSLFWQEKLEHNPDELYTLKAAIYAEFGKIICISIGYFSFHNDDYLYKIKSFNSDSEIQLLEDFFNTIFNLQKLKKDKLLFCGHNIKEFDLPYICRRGIINQFDLPQIFKSLQNSKPWEMPALDTLELWRFGDFKHFISLDLLASILGVETSKSDIDGSMVSHVFWVENNLQRIVNYCNKDVYVTTQVFLRLKNIDLIDKKNVQILK